MNTSRSPRRLATICGLALPIFALTLGAPAQPQPAPTTPSTPSTPRPPTRIDPKLPEVPRVTRPIDGRIVVRSANPDNITVVHIRESGKGAPAAAGVKNKTLSKEEFAALLKRPGVKVVTDKSLAKSMKNSEQVRAAMRERFAKVYGARAEVAELAKSPAKGGAPRIKVKTAKGQTQEVALLSADALIRDALAANAYTTDARHQASQYERVHKSVRGMNDAKAADALAKLPTPEQAAGMAAVEINKHLAAIVRLWVDIFKPTIGDGKPVTCAQEEGAGYGGDMTGDPAPGFSSNGLFNQCSWPLKNFNTCVRNQGARGSCVAFCVSAAAESLIAKNDNRWVNLSEQDVYKHFRLDWGPLPPDYLDDGYSSVIGLLAQMATFYRFPFERDWDYNPSYSRNPDTFANSCSNYNGGPCSNTNHQANHVCYTVRTEEVEQVVDEVCEFVETIPIIGGFLGEWVCEPVTKLIEVVKEVEVCVYEANIPGSSNYRIMSFVPFYDPILDPDIGIDLAKFYLGNANPVALGFNTPDSFDAATENGGFVQKGPASEKGRGGHCVMATGFVDNKNLPRGVPPGGGGGYIIVKNSWGPTFGDNGYAYLSYDWVKRWATSMAAVTAVGQ